MLWTVLALFLALLLVTATVVKTEKSRYLKQARARVFCGHRLLIPPWWTVIEESPTLLRFERTDTHYHWIARFQKRPCPPHLSAQQAAERECQRAEVEFDPDIVEKTADARFIVDSKCRQKLAGRSLRLEGTARQFQHKRCYLDLLVIKEENAPHYLSFYSWSSVLNGLIEGPYFDEVLKNLTLDGE